MTGWGGRERRHVFTGADDDRWGLPILILVIAFLLYIGGHVAWSIVR